VPWYWTDDIAHFLIEAEKMSADALGSMLTVPSAIRRDEASVEAVAQALLDEDEIPLAA
jgi:hypothetical protein